MPERVRLERPRADREAAFLAGALRSRALHRGRVAVPASRADFAAFTEEAHTTTRKAFLVIDDPQDAIAGVVELREIAGSTARVGYYAFEPHARRGLMRAGLALLLDFAAYDLALERLEAEIEPANRRSIALAESLGFVRVATARRVRKLGTRWREHVPWTLTLRHRSAMPVAMRRASARSRVAAP